MGIDFLDLQFRIEREFKIRFPRDEMPELLRLAVTGSRTGELPRDFTVAHFVALVDHLVALQRPEQRHDILERLRPLIVSCLYVEESEVVPDALLIRDLGMS